MSLLFRTVSHPSSWLAQEIHLSLCFPPSMGSPALDTHLGVMCSTLHPTTAPIPTQDRAALCDGREGRR